MGSNGLLFLSLSSVERIPDIIGDSVASFAILLSLYILKLCEQPLYYVTVC